MTKEEAVAKSRKLYEQLPIEWVEQNRVQFMTLYRKADKFNCQIDGHALGVLHNKDYIFTVSMNAQPEDIIFWVERDRGGIPLRTWREHLDYCGYFMTW